MQRACTLSLIFSKLCSCGGILVNRTCSTSFLNSNHSYIMFLGKKTENEVLKMAYNVHALYVHVFDQHVLSLLWL